MDLPLQITWRDIPPSEAVEADIREKAQKLEHFYDHIVSCHVVVEAPHAHHHKGKLYRVLIEIKVPGHAINVSRVPEQNHAHEDLYVTVRDAFDAARRQLQDYARAHRASNARPRKGPLPPPEPSTGEEIEE
jgi:ribosomal subunit interface protein